MATAFDYVINVLEIVKDPNEDEQAYLQHIAFELQNLDESIWEELPTDLQEWYNKAADAIASSNEADEPIVINPIPGMVKPKKDKAAKKPKEEVEEETEGEEAEREEAPKKRGRKPKADKPVKEPKPKREKKEKVPKEPKGPTAANAVREILCENMDLSLDQIMDQLVERGVNMQRSSMQVVALNTKQAFVIAMQVGEVKNKDGEVVLQRG